MQCSLNIMICLQVVQDITKDNMPSFTNTTELQANLFNNGIEQMFADFAKNNQRLLYARNATLDSPIGDIGTVSNEKSNKLSASVPTGYTIIGCIFTKEDKWAIFSTDNKSSEIGLYNDEKETYITIVNSDKLNFSTAHLINGTCRIQNECKTRLYWDDGFNPTRTMILEEVPWITEKKKVFGGTCFVDVDTEVLDIEKLRLAKLTDNIRLGIKKGSTSGELLNGSYFVVGAYTNEGIVVSDYSLPSNIQQIFNHDNMAGSLEITVEDIDTEYDEFELVLCSTINGNTECRHLGFYSTRTKNIIISTVNVAQTYNIASDIILKNNPIYDRSQICQSEGDMLVRLKPTDKYKFNYQPLANKITAYWVSIAKPKDYYRDGGNKVGYMRGEAYAFFIRWVFNTGDRSVSFFIPNTSGQNKTIAQTRESFRNRFPNITIGDADEEKDVVNSYGSFISKESEETFPDNKSEIWGELCGKKIPYHKFPDNNICKHFDNTNIYILGVVFDNIQAPLDINGNKIQNIVGYEILRGSREGNKTVIAKGIVNNMREYIGTNNKNYLYQNYPFNARGKDMFLSRTRTGFSKKGDSNFGHKAFLDSGTDLPLLPWGRRSSDETTDQKEERGNVSDRYYSFHSPDTNFMNPYLSVKELQLYGKLSGTVDGQFKIPEGHPKFKFLRTKAFVTSAILGLGYTMYKISGNRSQTTETPAVDGGTNLMGVGVVELVSGPSSPILHALQVGATAAAEIAMKKMATWIKDIEAIYKAMSGCDAKTAEWLANLLANKISGVASGRGGKTTITTEDTEWNSVPEFIRKLNALPIFFSYWTEGIDKNMAIMYGYAPYKQRMLQFVSHCLYNKFTPIDGLNFDIDKSAYVGNTFVTYDSGKSNDNDEVIVNNLNRSRTVVLDIKNYQKLIGQELTDNSQCLYSQYVNNRSYQDEWRGDSIPVAYSKKRQRTSECFYGALIQPMSNQYGQIDSIKQIAVSTGTEKIDINNNYSSSSKVLFGGDTYIGRYTEKNTMPFFYDWLDGEPNGTEIDYRLYETIPHPRFWMDTARFDVCNFIDGIASLIGKNDEDEVSSVNFSYSDEFDQYELKADVLKRNQYIRDIIQARLKDTGGDVVGLTKRPLYFESFISKINNPSQDSETIKILTSDSVFSLKIFVSTTKDSFTTIESSTVDLDDQGNKVKFYLYSAQSYIESIGTMYEEISETLYGELSQVYDAYKEFQLVTLFTDKKLLSYDDGYVTQDNNPLMTSVESHFYIIYKENYFNTIRQFKISQKSIENIDEQNSFVLAKTLDNGVYYQFKNDVYYVSNNGVPMYVVTNINLNTEPSENSFIKVQFALDEGNESKDSNYDYRYSKQNIVKYEEIIFEQKAYDFYLNKFPSLVKYCTIFPVVNKRVECRWLDITAYDEDLDYEKWKDFKYKYVNGTYKKSSESLRFNDTGCYYNEYNPFDYTIDLIEYTGIDPDEWDKYASSATVVNKLKNIGLFIKGDIQENRYKYYENLIKIKREKQRNCSGESVGYEAMCQYRGFDAIINLKSTISNIKTSAGPSMMSEEFINEEKLVVYGNGNWTLEDFDDYYYNNSGRIYNAQETLQTLSQDAMQRMGEMQQKMQQIQLNDNSIDSGNGDLKSLKNLEEHVPNDLYAFDLSTPKGFGFGVKEGYMYMSCSGVRDFYVESTMNVDLRDWGDDDGERHYDHREYTDLVKLFTPKLLKRGNYYKYDRDLQNDNVITNHLPIARMYPRYYDPNDIEKCYLEHPNRLIYSLPANIGSELDTWRMFLVNNKADYEGELSGIKELTEGRALLLFKKLSPKLVSNGSLNIKTNLTQITVGTGEKFSKAVTLNLSTTNDSVERGSCQNNLSVIGTKDGVFYISRSNRKIYFSDGQGITAILDETMRWWFDKYIPYQLLKQDLFNDVSYEYEDNPVIGIGFSSVYNPMDDKVYFSKKDWVLKDEYLEETKYIGGNKFQLADSQVVNLGNEDYFDDASWTMSLEMTSKEFICVSFHDWKPELSFSTSDSFVTTKNGSIWLHGKRTDSFCNFYGESHPFEIEYISSDKNIKVATVKSINYFMEVFVYDENGRDRFHVLDSNFDEAILYNSEQCSGLLALDLKPKNDPLKELSYPIVMADRIRILYSKEEQKYSFNQFYDIVKDRGEFGEDKRRPPIFRTKANGYEKSLVESNLDYSKSELEHKKLRHYKTGIILRKNDCSDENYVVSLASLLKLTSFR